MVEQQKSYEHVLTYLEDALRDGKLTLGQSLPPERELAEQLGISRNSVREAVRLLEHMGFLVSSQGAGNFISCNIQRNLQDSFDMLILLQQADGLPHGIAADAQLLGQLPLGGQGLAQGELAIPEGVLQIGQYVLVGFLLFHHMLSLPFQTISVDLSDCNHYTTSVNKL